jgi:hypothetical protein
MKDEGKGEAGRRAGLERSTDVEAKTGTGPGHGAVPVPECVVPAPDRPIFARFDPVSKTFLLPVDVRGEAAPGHLLEGRDEIRGVDERLVLGALFIGQEVFALPLGEHVDPRPDGRVDANLDDLACRLGREAAA